MSEWIKLIENTKLEIIDGDRGKSYPKQEEFSHNGYCLFLNAKNVTSTGFQFDELNFISKERDLLLRKGRLNRNDIVLTTRGTIGNVAYYGKEIPFANMRINSGMIIIRTKANIDFPKFVYYQFFSKYMQEQISQFATGSAQPQIPITSINKFSIILPPYHVQKSIAKVLSSFDNKIENCNKIMVNLNAQINALFKNWFIDFAPFADNLSEEDIPKGWRKYKFSDFITLKNEKSSDLDIQEFSVTNTGIFPRNTRFNKLLSTNRSNKIIKRNDLVFGMSREILNWGVMEEEIGGVSSAYTVFEVEQTKVKGNYLSRYMSSNISYFLDIIKPAAREGQGIERNVLYNKNIVVPDDKSWEKFLDIYQPMNNEIANQKKQIEKLANTRDTLLPKLMSGEIEVPVEE